MKITSMFLTLAMAGLVAGPLTTQAFAADQSLISTDKVSLMIWARSNLKHKKVKVARYHRRNHFGGWLDVDRDCKDTRHEVLVRDSSVPPRMSKFNRCRVFRGRWQGPYSGITSSKPQTVQIDHLVPLINAYYNGAHSWKRSRRCHFQNFLGYRGHLLATDGRTNQSKSGFSPSNWVPPKKSYRCEFLKHWLTIKTIWSLKYPELEYDSIAKIIRDEKCEKEQFFISRAELVKYRKLVRRVPASCK